VDDPCSQEIVSWTACISTAPLVWAWMVYTSEAGVSVALRVRVVVATTHGLADGVLDWEPFVVDGDPLVLAPQADTRIDAAVSADRNPKLRRITKHSQLSTCANNERSRVG